jgi:MipA family protein
MLGPALRLALLLAASVPSLAHAQDTGEEEDAFDGDYLIVGVGAASLPTYEGSDNSRIMPVFAATGELAGVDFSIRGLGLSVDLLPDQPGDVDFKLSGQVKYQMGRKNKLKDDVVELLPDLKSTIEVGFRAGVGIDDLVSNADSLSIGTSFRWDVTGRSDGMIISPSMSYLLPVSRGQMFGATIGTKWVNDSYADYHYSITPEGSALSGLPVYKAKGGFNEIDLGIATARDLNNNFLDGGLSIVAGVQYIRLLGSAAKTPITSIRGSRNQWGFAAGIAYIF